MHMQIMHNIIYYYSFDISTYIDIDQKQFFLDSSSVEMHSIFLGCCRFDRLKQNNVFIVQCPKDHKYSKKSQLYFDEFFL